jgi:replicative DNA helicase
MMSKELTKQKKNYRPEKNVDLTTMVFGKIPPQAKELEEAILGAIMIESHAFDIIAELLRPDHFYMEGHQLIFKAMMSLQQKSSPIDILTVSEELKRREDLEKVGGAYYITKLTNAVVSAANIETHSRIIVEKYLQREMISICGETIRVAYEDSSDAFDVIDEHEKMLSAVVSKYQHKHVIPITSLLVNAVRRIEELRLQDDHMTGVSSGFFEVDKLTHGWQPTDLIILAARPSVGKTALALNLARNAALSSKKTAVGFFSLEMSASQLTERLISAEAEIYLDQIKSGRLDEEQMKNLYTKGIQRLADAPIFIDDTGALNIYELRSKVRTLKSKQNVGLIIIDYLQLMSGVRENSNTNREQEISKISRDLKALAKELVIPIIALSQLSRETEKRKGEKTPQLSDLRESGAIEQDADVVMFLYRPEYYEVNHNELGETTHGETHVSFAKHRNGKIAKGKEAIKLKAKLAYQKFYNWDHIDDVKEKLGTGNWKPVSEAGNLFDKNDLS